AVDVAADLAPLARLRALRARQGTDRVQRRRARDGQRALHDARLRPDVAARRVHVRLACARPDVHEPRTPRRVHLTCRVPAVLETRCEIPHAWLVAKTRRISPRSGLNVGTAMPCARPERPAWSEPSPDARNFTSRL